MSHCLEDVHNTQLLPLPYANRAKQLVTRWRSSICQHWLLCTCLTVILSVSLVDTYLVYVYRDSIMYDEQNPICQMLIGQDPENLTWFYAGKSLGNLSVLTILVALQKLNYQHHQLVALSVASFQLLLSMYLGLSDPKSGFLDLGAMASLIL